MFAIVRLIDSQEHQYPKKTRSKDPEKSQQTIQKNHPDEIGRIQDPE
jgi:hypothetical protein